ncbi:hypothetical protein AB0I98_35470 [Streptomyces sp. NPDC050211]|uniref:hypothetical protein n=1 Tax=Streptomyces sp. NPDC050211 TaxID=3154932 RepID=UPI003439A629
MDTSSGVRELRKQAIEDLTREGRDPERYNVNGIIRDAWINGNGSAEVWRAAVDKHRIQFLVGDTVRVAVEIDGFEEYLYGRIEEFRTADNRTYRRRVPNPPSAYVELFERYSGALRPLSEITPEIDDFEITSEHEEVHRGAPAHNFGIFHCASGIHGGYTPPADVLVIHRASGIERRFCNDCNNGGQRARLGHQMWWDRQMCRDTIQELTEHPEQITGPADDEDADASRRWADAFPYLVPAKAAELYAQWKEHRGAA